MSDDTGVLRRLCGDLEDALEKMEAELAAEKEKVQQLTEEKMRLMGGAPPPPPPAATSADSSAAPAADDADADAGVDAWLEELLRASGRAPATAEDNRRHVSSLVRLHHKLRAEERAAGGGVGELELQRRLNSELEGALEEAEKKLEGADDENQGLKLQVGAIRNKVAAALDVDVHEVRDVGASIDALIAAGKQ